MEWLPVRATRKEFCHETIEETAGLVKLNLEHGGHVAAHQQAGRLCLRDPPL